MQVNAKFKRQNSKNEIQRISFPCSAWERKRSIGLSLPIENPKSKIENRKSAMSTRIFIPTPLRSYTDNRAEIEVEGTNIGEALGALIEEHPGLREHLFDSDGKLRSFVNIYLNDDDIRYLSEEKTPVESRDTISIIPAIAGGAKR
jgi:adenylyltransferase/sulfurtransferase